MLPLQNYVIGLVAGSVAIEEFFVAVTGNGLAAPAPASAGGDEQEGEQRAD